LSSCNLTALNQTYIHFDLTDQTRKQIIYSILIGCVAFIAVYIRVTFLNLLAERQTRIIQQTLFQSILKKDIYFFDTHKTGELSTCLTEDVNKIHNGIGDKLGSAVEIVSVFTCSLVIGKLLPLHALGMYRARA
jgi:ATP-binding cassette subfamily B (MDR/TAP) protein 1